MKAPLLSQSAFSPLTRSSLIACASLCAITASTFAAGTEQTWTGATDDLWSTVTNWNTTTPGSGDVAVFNASSTGNLTNRVSAPFSVLGVKVVDPAGAVTISPKLSAAAITADNLTDVLTYSAAPTAPLANDDVVTIGGTTVPTGLTAGTRYFVVNATATTFQLSATSGGAVINFTTDGAGVTVTGGPILTVGTSGIDMNSATQNLSIGSPLLLNTAQAWNVVSGRTLTIANTAASTGSTGTITKSGTGSLQLNATLAAAGGAVLSGGTTTSAAGNFVNSFGGPVTFEGGAILTNGNGNNTMTLLSNVVVAVGQSGILNMGGRIGWGNNDATVETLTGGGSLTLNAATTVARDDIYADMTAFTGTINFTGSGTVRLFINGGKVGTGFTNSTVDLAGTVNFNPQTNSGGNVINIGKLTGTSTTATLGGGSAGSPNYTVGGLGFDSSFDGVISGNASLTKTGIGTLTLTNTALAYTGATTVNAGTLKLNGTKTGIGATTVNATLTGTGTSAGTTTIANGGTLAPGDNGIGNINFANLTLATGSTLSLQFGAGNDTATVQTGGTLTLSSGAYVDVNGFGTDGTYTIINTTGATVVGTASTALTAFNGVVGKTYSFSATANAIQMTVSSSDPNNYWKVDGGGTWNLAANWTKNTIPNASGAIAKIGPGPSGFGGAFTPVDFAITMDATRTVGTLGFDDVNSNITIDPGTSGSLSFDNGANPSVLSLLSGNHIINAPIAVDADDLSTDVSDTYSLTINGTVGGSGAALSKAGLGTLVLTGNNTYDGGTTLAAGTISINSATSLGNASGALTFAGGTLRLDAPIAGVTRNYQVTGANNALINTNGNDFGYDGVISPVGGATGGLTKSGAGALTLSAAQTYTGATSVSGGGLNFPTGSSTNGTAVNVTNGGNLTVSGGSLTASAASAVTGAAMNLDSGSMTLNGGLNANTGNPNANYNVNLTGGTFSASFLALGRGAAIITNPAAGSATFGLYVNGATTNIAGALTLGTGSATNSSVSGRIDSGSLTVGGTVLLQINSPDRWTILDVNGGTFTSTEAVTGVQIGSGQVGSSAFLVRNGTATVERFFLTQAAASTETSRINLTGGALYVGAGGIVGNNNGGTGVMEVLLGGGTLGAKAPWTSAVAATLTGPATIKAADAANAAQDITLSGAIGGTGSLTKTGAGALNLTGTNTYIGNTTVSAGTLSLSTASLDDTGTVDVSATGSAILNLNFTGNDIVAGFSIDGVAQATGTWGSLTSSAAHKTALITGDGILNVGGVTDPFTDWISGFPAVGGQTAKTDDPDHDGLTNLDEFALDGNPASGVTTGKVRSRIETVGAEQALVITLPVRDGASFTGATSKTATIDDIVYTIEGSNNLSLFDQGVTEIAVSAAGMPTPLTTGWSYHTFRLDGAIGGATPRGPKGFLHATIADAP